MMWVIVAALLVVGLVILAMSSFKAGVSLDKPVQSQMKTDSQPAAQKGPAESNGVSNLGKDSSQPAK